MIILEIMIHKHMKQQRVPPHISVYYSNLPTIYDLPTTRSILFFCCGVMKYLHSGNLPEKPYVYLMNIILHSFYEE